MPEITEREIEQLSQLTHMRRLATGLLVLMSCIFVGARVLQHRVPWMAFVAAFAEAAMVGGLADWFAVTALFRAPLGMPIPHTAIIPRNKDRIGTSVANFLEHNFLTPDVISAELASIDFAGVASAWLATPDNSRAVALKIAGLAPALLRVIADEDIGGFLQGQATGLLKSLHFGPVAADILTILIKQEHHQQLFDHLLGLVARALEQNRQLIREKIDERSPRWIPKAIDERFFNSLLHELEVFLAGMAEPDSEWRVRFRTAIDDMAVKLKSSPEYETKIADYIAQTVQHPLFRSYSEGVWRDMKRRIFMDIRSEHSHAVARVDQALQALANALMQDPAVRRKLDDWMGKFATDVVVARRTVIADLVRRVIQSWDAQTVSHKFELYVGRDLQYIRINGTLVGGLVGLALYVISLAL